MGSRQTVRGQRHKARIYVFVAVALFLICGGSIASVFVYQVSSEDYHTYLSIAQAGEQHLRTAEGLLVEDLHTPFTTHQVDLAQQEFVAASKNFAQVNDGLKLLPQGSTSLPFYGGKIRAALLLVPLAQDVAQAGIMSCAILKTLVTGISHPLQKQGQGLTTQDVTLLDADFYRIQHVLTDAIHEAEQLQPSDMQFDPRVAKTFTSFQQYLPALRTWLTAAGQLVPVLPALFGIGEPTNYLIEVLDSTELRPGGGFIGNYGIATLSGGGLAHVDITDVDLLDRPFYAAGHRIPFPPQYKWFNNYLSQGSWSLRDSNLDADFPTAAHFAELNYAREGGNVPVQGVIAITPAFMQQVLEITGPITVPEYHETVTAQNLIDRIHYHQLGPAGEGPDTVPSPDGYSSLRKHFTALLAKQVMTRVRQIAGAALPRFLQLLANSMYSKDMQVYLNSSVAEQLLQRFQLGATLQAPLDDGLFVVDANVGGDKANEFIQSTVNDHVTLDAAGNALHHTTLTYAWTKPGNVYGSPLYKDYLRVYVPTNSSLQLQQGWHALGTSEAFGSKVWIGDFQLRYGQTLTITLQWTEPGAAKKDANGWHYQYLLQRQAGILRNVNLSIQLPLCATRATFWGGLIASTQHGATLTQTLNENKSVGVDYGCS